MPSSIDDLDRQLIDLLRVNARLPVVKIAKALGCARSTVQLRLKALEQVIDVRAVVLQLKAQRRINDCQPCAAAAFVILI